MRLFLTEYALGLTLLALAATASAALAYLAYCRRGSPGALSLAAMMAAGSLWAATYAVEFVSQDTTLRSLFGSLKYVGVVTVPVLWLTFALRYTGRIKHLSRTLVGSLCAIPLVTLTLVFTNSFHHLVRSYPASPVAGAAPEVSHGPWFWAHSLYSYSLLVVGTYLLLSTLSGSSRTHRGQRFAVAVGALVPWAANAVYILELIPSLRVDPTPFAFSLTGGVLLWGAYRSRLLEIAPVARGVVFESMHEGVLVTDNQGRVVDVNPAAASMLGTSASEVVGLALDRLIPEAEEVGRHPHSESGSQSTSYSVRYRREDGSEPPKVYELDLLELSARGPVVAEKLALIRDVTRRSSAEQALRESEERFRQLFEQSADPMIVHDLEGEIVDVNRQTCESLGYSREELVGMSVPEIELNYAPLSIGQLWERMTPGEHEALEGVHLRKDGSSFPVEVRLGLLERSGEALVIAICRDITERKRAEEELRASEERFRQLFEQSADALLVHDEQGRMVDCNAEACRSLGYTREELLDMSVGDYVASGLLSEEEIRQRGEDTVWRRAMRGEAGEVVAYNRAIHCRKDGTTFPVEVAVGSVDYRGQRLILAAARDVSERERDREQLATTAARLASLIESMPSGILVEDDERNILHANHGITEMFEMEISAEELVRENCDTSARDVMDLLADPQGFVDRIEEIFEGGRMVVDEEVHFADGRVLERDYVPILVGEDYRGHLWHYRDITQRKRDERALVESEERFRTAFEDASTGVALVGLDNRYLQVNSALCEMLGYSEAELLGKASFEFTHPDDLEASQERTRQMLAEGGPQTISLEKRYLHSDGSVVWAISDVSLVRDADGKPVHFVSQFHDITQRKGIEQALADSEARFRQLFEQSVDALMVHDEHGRYVDVNAQACRLYGYSRGEFLRLSVSDLSCEAPSEEEIARRQREEGGTLWQRSMASEPGRFTFSLEDENKRKDGRTFTAEVHLGSVDYSGRRLILVATRDISERKRMENALRESEARFRQLFENSADALFVAHPETREVVDCNAEACRSLGYAREELLTLRVEDFAREVLSEEEKERRGADTPWRRTLAGEPGTIIGFHKDVHRRKDGTTFPVEVGIGSIDYAGRRMVFGSCRDVTERERMEHALRESEARFRQLFEQSVDAVIVHDEEGNVVDANQKTSHSLGYTREELLTMKVGDYEMKLLSEDERAQRERSGGTLWQRIVANEPGAVTGLHIGEHRRKDGTSFPVEAHVGGVDYGGRRLILSSMRDITERQRAEEAVRESERRLRTVTSGAPIVLFALDREGVVTFEDGSALRELGMEPGQDVGRSWFEAYPHLPGAQRQVRLALRGEEVTATVEIAERTYHTRYSPQRSEEGELTGVLGVATDITDRRELEKELEFRATHDPLTGLPNRALFEERLSAALSRLEESHDTRPDSSGPAVLFMDLDNFKIVNDSLGHEAGDELLAAAASRLRGCLRPPDTVARLGGDEFAVLLEEGGAPEARLVADRIRARLMEPFSLGEAAAGATGEAGYMVVEASVGIAIPEPDSRSVEESAELLRRADLAMYSAKEQSEGLAVFEPWMDEQSQQRFELERDLRRAIAGLQNPRRQPSEEEFTLHYQPKVSLKTGRIVGVEALLRWQHPRRGLLQPAEFVPLAQTLRLMIPLGRWALRTACRKARQWRELHSGEPGILMSVNLSAQELYDPGLVDEVRASLTESGLEPGSLVLEISEEAAVADAAPAVEALRRLKELKVGLALDDFGTGYSALSYLRDLPLDYVKIDRSLVSGMMAEASNLAIVSATISLAHALGLEVIAEGVQTPEEAAELRTLGGEMGQGFYWHPPLAAVQVQRLLQTTWSATPREEPENDDRQR